MALVAGASTPPPRSPCVIDASGRGQTTLAMELAELAARREPLPGPCVLVIGAVAASGDAGGINRRRPAPP